MRAQTVLFLAALVPAFAAPQNNNNRRPVNQQQQQFTHRFNPNDNNASSKKQFSNQQQQQYQQPQQNQQQQYQQSQQNQQSDQQTQQQQYQEPSRSNNNFREPQREATTFIPILRFDKEQSVEGGYRTLWETGNNILVEETGVLKSFGDKENAEAVVQQGSYSYTSPEGQIINVQYTADEKGFRASGDHLPTPPPIPADIQKSLDVIYAGIREQQNKPNQRNDNNQQQYQNDGQYNDENSNRGGNSGQFNNNNNNNQFDRRQDNLNFRPSNTKNNQQNFANNNRG